MAKLGLSDVAVSNSCSAEPTPAQVAVKTQRLSAYIGSVLKLPDVMSVEEVETLPILQGLAQQLGDDYHVKYTAYLLPGHDPSGINVGFLVRSDRVHVVSVQQLAADETWVDDGATEFVHDHPPLLLTAGTTITWACTYDNPSTKTLTFGESAATNEMCIFPGEFFNKDGAQISVQSLR